MRDRCAIYRVERMDIDSKNWLTVVADLAHHALAGPSATRSWTVEVSLPPDIPGFLGSFLGSLSRGAGK